MTNGQHFSIRLTQFVEILVLSAHLDNHKKLHTGSVMHTWEMTPMYDPDSDFCAPKKDGILPHLSFTTR
jgi:5-methylthioribose kinase